MPLDAGTRVGPYEIGAPIGKGGMGEVYRARDTKLGREVAIKILPEELAADEERVARFERETKLLASLNHPNIAGIYGLEEEGLSEPSAVNFDNVHVVAKRLLGERLGALPRIQGSRSQEGPRLRFGLGGVEGALISVRSQRHLISRCSRWRNTIFRTWHSSIDSSDGKDWISVKPFSTCPVHSDGVPSYRPAAPA